MKLRININPKTFFTAFAAHTSRGTITQKKSYFLFLEDGSALGVGEGAPLPGLSLDGEAEWNKLAAWLLNKPALPDLQEDAYAWAQAVATHAGVPRASSIRYALESAALSLLSGQPELYYKTTYTDGAWGLPINGLVWMDSLPAMRHQAEQKVHAGFTTIKFKIGTQDWAQERAMLQDFRRAHMAQDITIRVDANGAYTEEQAYRVLDDLRTLHVHSIEQPIRAGQPNALRRLVQDGSTPIALDEEFVTKMPTDELLDMLAYVAAPFWVLKPTLIGGLGFTEKLLSMAKELQAAWWLTSSLETPVGLTPLAQLSAKYAPSLPQGLSTGKIYTQTLRSPNLLDSNKLYFDTQARFDIGQLRQPEAPQPEQAG